VNEEIRYFKEVHGEFSVLAILKRAEPKASTSTVYDSNLKKYGITFAYQLVMSVILFYEPYDKLDEAEEILKNFKKTPTAEKLLLIIKELKSK